MASILEFTVATEAADAMDNTGLCAHGCTSFSPLGLARAEADDIQRFDPDAFEKLNHFGVTIHEVEIEDFDYIGSLSHLAVVNQFDSKTTKKLYKHAIAVRLGRDLLIANESPEKDTIEAVSLAFGNAYHIL
ncbi:hypothetical protein ASE04_24820 [Rhizobium sp. Root708]|uniref:hypothetical protein n=1 Tax=Rhizobium sp. Root708 TaxID=1736592 RepID=UPI0006F2E2C1|nr:hypothetical protein [Rhizobium sp. Root708]KRB60296.1 hypothetical protein ASE04_24820 [Rhizobium sp. Root708]